MAVWVPVVATSLSYALLCVDRVFSVARSQRLVCCFLLCFTLCSEFRIFVHSSWAGDNERAVKANRTAPPEGMIDSGAPLQSLWYAFGLDLLLVSVATISGLEPHVAVFLAIVLTSLLHARQHINWRWQYGQDIPWSPAVNLLPLSIASAVAYSQANMSRTAFAANWLRAQDNDTQLEQQHCQSAPSA